MIGLPSAVEQQLDSQHADVSAVLLCAVVTVDGVGEQQSEPQQLSVVDGSVPSTCSAVLA